MVKPSSVKPKPSKRSDVPVVVISEQKRREIASANIPPLIKPNIINISRFATIRPRLHRCTTSVKPKPSQRPVDCPLVEEKSQKMMASPIIKPNIMRINRAAIVQKFDIQTLSTTHSKAAPAKKPETLKKDTDQEEGEEMFESAA